MMIFTGHLFAIGSRSNVIFTPLSRPPFPFYMGKSAKFGLTFRLQLTELAFPSFVSNVSEIIYSSRRADDCPRCFFTKFSAGRFTSLWEV